jgi:peptidoglycan-N-acetylglucosamine deacetylase
MCCDEIPPGVVARPEPHRRQFLRAGLAGGGLAATAVGLAACTEDAPTGPAGRSPTTAVPSRVEDREAITNGTYTGLSERDEGLTIRALIEVTDAGAPSDQLRGTHRLAWDVATTQPMVALSFDDGPDPRFTPRILDALAAVGARATFFMMGYNVTEHTDLARQVLSGGHEVGNHTWSHQDLAFEDPPSARREIQDCKAALADLLGSDTTYFRPPRGELSGAALRIASEENYDTFLWSVSRNDPAAGTPEIIADHIVSRLRPGAIIDMHDSIGRGLFLPQDSPFVRLLLAKREQDTLAVPQILERGQAAGLKFVTMSELLASGINPGALSPSIPAPAGAPNGPTTVPPSGPAG